MLRERRASRRAEFAKAGRMDLPVIHALDRISHDASYAGQVPADCLFVAHLVRMMVMPAMAVVMPVVVVAFVMYLTVVVPVRMGMGTMVMMSLMKLGGAPDLLKFRMQHHWPLKPLQVSHG
jgi:hypothetical protein